MNRASDEKRAGAIWGTFIGDALALPVHWYYDRAALLVAAAGMGQIPARFCEGLHDAAALRRQVNRQAATRTETLPCNCHTLLSVL